MNSLARFACYCVSFSLRYRQGYRVFPIVSSYLIGQQLRIVTGIKMQSRGQANGSDVSNEHVDSVKRSTRSEVKQKEKEKRDFYLKMSIVDKRKLYKCKKKFNMLEDIPTWDEYYHKNKADLLKKLGKKKTKPLYEVNEAINRKVSVWKGDITTLEIDAIVNAANSSLLGGGGVDGAIHEAAGKKLLEECVTLHGCKTGEAKITGGYKLPAKYVIHTVGPIGEKELLLTNAYENSLKVMMENKLRSLALPCISTGIYGYDNQKACHVALKVVREFLSENADSVDRIIFCLFLPKDVDLYEENMQNYFPVETIKINKEEISSDVEMKETESKTISKIKTKDKKGTSSDVEMKETESTIESKVKTEGGSVGKEKVTATESEDKKGTSSDVEMKETESTIESKVKTEGGSVGKEKVTATESEGKEKTSSDTNNEKSADTTKSKTKGKDSSPKKENTESLKAASKEKSRSDADNEKSTETTKSKTKGEDSSLTKENTESLKAKDKKGTSSDVEMKETESTIESKLETEGGSVGKEKVTASESEGHDMETESINKSSDDAQALLGKTNVSKNENGDKETDDKQFGKCDPVQTSKM